MRKILPACFLLLAFTKIFAQASIDVLHYKYELELSDESDAIAGKATIRIKALATLDSVVVDLVSGSKGMQVYNVQDSRFRQAGTVLVIYPSRALQKNEERELVISYNGTPADGLIISKNKFGQRTFFADNWPNRAHYWIPCIDNPADKASVEFIVTAPAHYQVVSNGVLEEETSLPGNKKLTHWKEDLPLPTKVMVIGAADFAVQHTGNLGCIPVSSWVFVPNKTEGFADYAPALDILSFFNSYIAPYPYKKLANVQSKTTFGGMENASAIFYFENSVDGKQDQEELLAHEIVHQWFGNMATEKSFAHLWLSEGFATYFTIVYMEKKYGINRAAAMRQEDRAQVIAFVKNWNKPVVDSVSPYMSLLNANSYQKGGWILHMLRRQLGDSVFHKAVQEYYASYAGRNADTRDFERICEKVSGQNLSVFFQQWLYTPGIPQLNIRWRYDAKTHQVNITVKQLQNDVFRFPLSIAVETASTKAKTTTLQVSQQEQHFSIAVTGMPVAVKADSSVDLLFDGKLSQEK